MKFEKMKSKAKKHTIANCKPFIICTFVSTHYHFNYL